MQRCWHDDPKERGTFTQIQQRLEQIKAVLEPRMLAWREDPHGHPPPPPLAGESAGADRHAAQAGAH